MIALAAPLIISVCVGGPFHILTVSLFKFGFPFPYRDFVEKAFKDNDPEIIRIYAPLNHKAGVKCSYVYILLKKTFKD